MDHRGGGVAVYAGGCGLPAFAVRISQLLEPGGSRYATGDRSDAMESRFCQDMADYSWGDTCVARVYGQHGATVLHASGKANSSCARVRTAVRGRSPLAASSSIRSQASTRSARVLILLLASTSHAPQPRFGFEIRDSRFAILHDTARLLPHEHRLTRIPP
ncbi:hypothetical protein DENSPDRAFT_227281 [Dentipellis sp. KUC8613]|nr:hypothetical protein DENSPDRAFT_227281 [Dentipellis sp. KUC8613]